VLTAEDVDSALGLVHGHAPVVLLVEAGRLEQSRNSPRFEELLKRATLVVLADSLNASAIAATVRGTAFAVLDRLDAPPPGLAVLIDSARRSAEEVGSGAPFDEPRFVASSRALKALVGRVGSLADASMPVLILGEEGTGKRSLARLLHARGGRRARPFVLMSFSETGGDTALAALESAFAAAGAGTVVLDRIDLLERHVQAVLARSIAEAPPAARLVATALPGLREAERAGEFSRDLYYRLAGSILDLPRLCDRPDDIPVLAYTFARQSAEELGLPSKRLSPEALRALRGARWEGNIPELAARVVRAVTLCSKEVITLGDLGFVRSRSDTQPSDDVVYYPLARKQSIGEFERSYVDTVLSQAGGNITRAAQLAGMDRANFRRLVKRSRSSAAPAIVDEAGPGGAADGDPEL